MYVYIYIYTYKCMYISWPHVFSCVLRRVKDHQELLHASPLLKKACPEAVVSITFWSLGLPRTARQGAACQISTRG